MEEQTNQYLAQAPIGKLMMKFAVPCVLSLLVSSLYNIVDQVFIGWGVGYLGNGATNVWERAGLIHEGKVASPQPAETLAEAGRILEKLVVKKRPRPHVRPQIKQFHNRV